MLSSYVTGFAKNVTGFAKILIAVVMMIMGFLFLEPFDEAIFNTHDVIALLLWGYSVITMLTALFCIFILYPFFFLIPSLVFLVTEFLHEKQITREIVWTVLALILFPISAYLIIPMIQV